MKTTTVRFVVAAVAAAFTTGSALALTVPVAEDTFTTTAGVLTSADGAAAALAVNVKQSAFVRFDLSNPNVVPAVITPDKVVSATLRLYATGVTAPSALTLRLVTSEWHETFTAKSAPAPSVSPVGGIVIPPVDVAAKHFISVDVTAAVKAALTAGGNDFGFAITTGGPTTKVLLASKEGSPGSAAQLDIEADLSTNTNTDTGTGPEAVTNLILPATSGSAGIVFSGTSLLLHTFGVENFFAGTDAGNLSMTGSSNVGVGSGALSANAIGSSNTAVGNQALVSNTTGNFNTAMGDGSLAANKVGRRNTAVGTQSLASNKSGIQNTALGDQALNANTNGDQNTALGVQALLGTSGSNNIAVGYQAGMNIGNNDGNIDIGNVGNAGDTGVIRIGTSGTHNTVFISGIQGTTLAGSATVHVNVNGQLGILTSSRRFKTDIQPMDKASEVLLSLKPVTFRYKPELDPTGIPQFGLIAEEVAGVCPDLVLRDADGRIQTVRYEQVNAMLLNEFLKEHRRAEAGEARMRGLEKAAGDQAQQIQALTARLSEMGRQMEKVSRQVGELHGTPVVVSLRGQPSRD